MGIAVPRRALELGGFEAAVDVFVIDFVAALFDEDDALCSAFLMAALICSAQAIASGAESIFSDFAGRRNAKCLEGDKQKRRKQIGVTSQFFFF